METTAGMPYARTFTAMVPEEHQIDKSGVRNGERTASTTSVMDSRSLNGQRANPEAKIDPSPLPDALRPPGISSR